MTVSLALDWADFKAIAYGRQFACLDEKRICDVSAFRQSTLWLLDTALQKIPYAIPLGSWCGVSSRHEQVDRVFTEVFSSYRSKNGAARSAAFIPPTQKNIWNRFMCFSEPVSFVAGGMLLAGGAFASWKALKINKRYIPIALMPVMAGAQQLMEGSVWMGLNDGDPSMVWWGAMGFIFFSWLIWPVWIPFGVYVLEPPESRRKKLFLYLALAGATLGLLLYVPHIINPDWIDVTVNRDSLAYEGTMLLDYLIPRWLTYVIYMFLIIAPPLMSTYRHMRLFGLTLIVIVTVVYTFLVYAYISFFCLLAGIGTLHLIYIILRNKCCRECPALFN